MATSLRPSSTTARPPWGSLTATDPSCARSASEWSPTSTSAPAATQRRSRNSRRPSSSLTLSAYAWVLLQDGNVARAEIMNGRALEVGRRLRSPSVLLLALTGSALLHRHHGRNRDAAAAATEALELYVTGWPRRFGNRIDPELEIRSAAAVCCAVLGIVAAEEGDGLRAAALLGHADHLRGDAGAPVTALQHDELESARDTAMALLGPDRYVAAFEQGGQSDLGELLAFSS